METKPKLFLGKMDGVELYFCRRRIEKQGSHCFAIRSDGYVWNEIALCLFTGIVRVVYQSVVTRSSMKFGLLSILTLCAIIPCFGQQVEKIVIIVQETNEPPTKPRPVEYRIEYKIDADGDFIVGHFRKGIKRSKLTVIEAIERERINKISNWEALKKMDFTLPDLGIDRRTIALAVENSDHKLNFELPDEIVLDVDSFHFCQNSKMTKSISTGGETMSVTMLAKPRPMAQFTFHSNDIGTGQFNLKDYIVCYAVLNDRVPVEFPHLNFFSKEKLAEVVVYYQKTVECEGYYYKEYADKNQLTGKERRMRVGWDLVEYMNQRVKQ